MLLNVYLNVSISVLHYICYELTPLENHCSKAKVLLTLQCMRPNNQCYDSNFKGTQRYIENALDSFLKGFIPSSLFFYPPFKIAMSPYSLPHPTEKEDIKLLGNYEIIAVKS